MVNFGRPFVKFPRASYLFTYEQWKKKTGWYHPVLQVLYTASVRVPINQPGKNEKFYGFCSWFIYIHIVGVNVLVPSSSVINTVHFSTSIPLFFGSSRCKHGNMLAVRIYVTSSITWEV